MNDYVGCKRINLVTLTFGNTKFYVSEGCSSIFFASSTKHELYKMQNNSGIKHRRKFK